MERPGLVEAPEKQKVYGVFLFLVNEENEVLMLLNRETKEKTQKIAGQFTTPAETHQTNESLIFDTLPRAIKEEVGTIKTGYPTPKFRGVIEIDTTTPILVSAYEIRILKKHLKFDPEDKSEVANHHWVPISEIADQRIPIGQFEIPRYRTPIPEFAENIRKVERDEKFPAFQKVAISIPEKVFRDLQPNRGTQFISTQGPNKR